MQKTQGKSNLWMVYVLLAVNLLAASSTYALSLQEWKEKQARHDIRLKQQPSMIQQSTSHIIAVPQQQQTVGQVAQQLGEQIRLDINRASAEEIVAKLDGIGHKKAQAIIQYRQQQGAFRKVDDLLAVKGIGEKTLAKNRDKIIIQR